jgi:hypothetical protein
MGFLAIWLFIGLLVCRAAYLPIWFGVGLCAYLMLLDEALKRGKS